MYRQACTYTFLHAFLYGGTGRFFTKCKVCSNAHFNNISIESYIRSFGIMYNLMFHSFFLPLSSTPKCEAGLKTEIISVLDLVLLSPVSPFLQAVVVPQDGSMTLWWISHPSLSPCHQQTCWQVQPTPSSRSWDNVFHKIFKHLNKVLLVIFLFPEK